MLTREGELVVTSSASRYQLMNRADCMNKLRQQLWRFEDERQAAATRERAEVLSATLQHWILDYKIRIAEMRC